MVGQIFQFPFQSQHLSGSLLCRRPAFFQVSLTVFIAPELFCLAFCADRKAQPCQILLPDGLCRLLPIRRFIIFHGRPQKIRPNHHRLSLQRLGLIGHGYLHGQYLRHTALQIAFRRLRLPTRQLAGAEHHSHIGQ